MYPNPPDFTTASDSDAWWIVSYTDANGNNVAAVCSTGGRAFVDILQQTLGVTVDGQWGPGTAAALASAVQRAGGSSVLVGGIQADASARRVSYASSLRGAAFLLHSGQSFGGGTPIGISENQIVVMPQAVPPQWNTAAPPGPSGDILPSCMSPQAQTPTSQPTTIPDQAQTPTDQSQPATQPDMSGTGSMVPSPSGFFPTVVPPATPATPTSSPNYTAVVVGGVAVVTLGAIAWAAFRNPSPKVPEAKALPGPRPQLRSSRPNPLGSERHELRHKSHTIKLTGRDALTETESVRRKYAMSEPQSQAIQAALREGFQLTSRPSGSGLFWHLKMLASPRSAKATGIRLERSGFRELPMGEFNLLLRKKS
jgi:hypothetical protein